MTCSQVKSPLASLLAPRRAGGIRSAFCTVLLLSLTTPFFASQPQNLCSSLHGLYTGTYRDTTGLFIDKPFPITTYLSYEKGHIYGYTLPAKDADGPAYGQKPYALIFGICENNTLSNVYVLKNTSHPCGDPAPGPMPLSQTGPLTLTINYENAMINATLLATLLPSKAPFTVDIKRLQVAVSQAKLPAQTCH